MNNESLRDNFIKAVNCFKHKPAMLKQTLRDAELYKQQGILSETDVTILKRLAMNHSSCVF
jgi:hypothetical protein